MDKILKYIQDYKNYYYKNLKNFNIKNKKNESIILLYHGVSENVSKGIENHSQKHINYKEFEKNMVYLKKSNVILSMDELIYLKENNDKFPVNSVVITFDDGFENNYSVAAPILDNLNIPATFYITSGLIGTEILFWVDIIEDCINRTKEKFIEIELGPNPYHFILESNNDKIYAINEIKSFCKSVNYKIKDTIIDQVIMKTKIKPSEESSSNYKKMSWKQLKEIHENSLFLVGGHSTLHNILSFQPKEDMKDDIIKSIKLLEDNLNTRIKHYSYPEGQAIHYNNHVKKILKSQGIKCCPSAIPGINNHNTDLFELRRIMVGFWGMPLPFLDKNFR